MMEQPYSSVYQSYAMFVASFDYIIVVRRATRTGYELYAVLKYIWNGFV